MRRVRMQDVADLAGVSMKTVSNVVNDYPHVSEKMRKRVRDAIRALDYRPSRAGRSLATGETGMIGLAFSDLGLPYFAGLAHAFSNVAQRLGYRVIISETGGTREGEESFLEGVENGLVDGIVFQPDVLSGDELAERGAQVPLVLLGESPAPSALDRVMIDNVAAARCVTELLVSSGRRRVGFVGSDRERPSATTTYRLEGYRQAITAAGLPWDSKLIFDSPEFDFFDGGGARRVPRFSDGQCGFDALVCRDDLLAMETLRVLALEGVSVPDDVAVCGWDDIRTSTMTVPSLTSVSPDLRALSEMAIDLLKDRINGMRCEGRHQLAPFVIVQRESTSMR